MLIVLAIENGLQGTEPRQLRDDPSFPSILVLGTAQSQRGIRALGVFRLERVSWVSFLNIVLNDLTINTVLPRREQRMDQD